jgi:hypothetical protein
MSRGDDDRAARSRTTAEIGAGAPLRGDATATRDAGAPYAVVGVASAGRSRYAGPSGDAPGRPPRKTRGCDRRIAAGHRQYDISDLRDLSEAAA